MDARKKIAVFTANIYEPMVRSIQEGINKAAAETNVKVIYFTSFSDSFSSKIYTQYHKSRDCKNMWPVRERCQILYRQIEERRTFGMGRT